MNARQIALGGVTAALAVVIMCLGGLVPLATYILPMLLCILLQLLLPRLTRKGAWVWYSAVSLLSVLLAPDKEAAAVWVFLGYYPIIKPYLDGKKFGIILKLLIFNASTLIMYALLIHLFGMAELANEFSSLGLLLGGITLALGNVCFFLLDMVLSRFATKFIRR